MTEAHLNGSVNLESAEDVFRTVAGLAGGVVTKIPDGETGPRQMWITALVPRFRSVPQLDATEVERLGRRKVEFRIKPGFTGDDLEIPELGYAQFARDSYALFARLRDEGVIAPGIRFQVSLPSLFAGSRPFIVSEHLSEFQPAYERRLRTEVGEILGAIPHKDLAVQWDCTGEVRAADAAAGDVSDPRFNEVADELAALADWIPDDVPVGFHLCYGDEPTPDSNGVGKHWKEPEDTSALVMLANAVTERASRVVSWFSMPVPISRDDDAYFEPLHGLRLAEGSKLHLGLVHHEDGVAGTQRRIETAKRHYPSFGVATECGMGRKPREAIPTLLEIHAAVNA